MSEDAHISEVLPELQAAMRAVTRTVAPELGSTEREFLVGSMLDVVVNTLAGFRVLVPAARQARQAEQIERAWREGASARDIARQHGVSLATAYRHHPSRRKILTGDHELRNQPGQGTDP